MFGHPPRFFFGTEGAVEPGMSQGPFHPPARLADEPLVVQQVRQGNQSVQRPAFPTFASAAQPAAIWAEIGPELVHMAAPPFGLDAELARKPAMWSD